jgi:hypothetical protein
VFINLSKAEDCGGFFGAEGFADGVAGFNA